MNRLEFVVLVLLLRNGSGSGREAINVSESDEWGSTTTITTQAAEGCVTSGGDQSGECSLLEECYPLLRGNDKGEEARQSDSNLRQEIRETLQSSQCSNDQVCCKGNGTRTLLEDVLWDVNEETDEAGAGDIFFPEKCGKSFVSWSGKGNKITGGKNSLPRQFPAMVAIFGKNGKITCGGSLISDEFVVTAAHCLAAYGVKDLSGLKLHLGDHNIMSLRDGPHEVRKISQVYLHKGFNSQTYHNDVALIKMDKPVAFTDRIQPICLPSSNSSIIRDAEGRTVVVAGWGRDRQWGFESSILRFVEMPMWKLAECQKAYRVFAPNRIMDGMNFCAGDGRRNKDACIGDSGGPLMHLSNSKWTQLGIVSWGKGCGSFPGVYTSLPNFIPWIEKQINRGNSQIEEAVIM